MQVYAYSTILTAARVRMLWRMVENRQGRAKNACTILCIFII